MNLALDLLRRHPALRESPGKAEVLSTGFAALDSLLPGGGWQLGALTEILAAREGIGELGLLMPALARLTGEGRLAVWVSAPYWPYGPALAARGVKLSRTILVGAPTPRETLWATEQALRSGACGAVLAWGTGADGRCLRRLQLAAEEGRCLGVLFPPATTAATPSPAALRLAVEATPGGLAVRILKGRAAGRAAVLHPSAPAP